MIILPIACLYLFGVLDFAFLNFNIYLRLIAGGIILLGGFMLFFSAHKHLNENWSPIIEKKFSKSRSLILEGPYRYIRHPIYVGSMILLLGFFLLSANWLFATIPLIILIIFYSIKIPLEEKELERNFGKKYIEYKKRTGGFFPKIR
jgi:protein-S-isoprenylcysteine O-methyltransferase Ste14